MSMIYCRECGKQISDQAKKCPHCGAPSKPSSNMFSLPKVLGYILFGGIAWFTVMAINVELKPTASSKEVTQCNSDAAKEKAIKLSGDTVLGKALGVRILDFRSISEPIRDGNKLVCKAVALMSNGNDTDYLIKTELINGKQMLGISIDDGSYDHLIRKPAEQVIQAEPALPEPASPPPERIQQTAPATVQQSAQEEAVQQEPLTPTWCDKAGTPNEKLICATPELSVQSAKFEQQWKAYRQWHTDEEIADKKAVLNQWNKDVLQKAEGVSGIALAYSEFMGNNAFLTDYPNLVSGQSYESIREKLLADGWKPFISPDADECTAGHEVCEGRYPETESCAGTGLGNCRFTWQKGGRVIVIFTIGDDHRYEGMEAVKLEKQKPLPSITGWWGYDKNGCNDTDNQYRVALGNWEKTDDGIKFGSGHEAIGMYDGGCNLSGRKDGDNKITYDADCKMEDEKSVGTVTISFIDDSHINLDTPFSQSFELVRCPAE